MIVQGRLLYFADICKMASKVNLCLKNLITEEDDEDITTDAADEVKVNLLSGSPSKRSSGGGDKKATPTKSEGTDDKTDKTGIESLLTRHCN